MKYVIIGNSTAAVACIEAIRTNDLKGSITVISSENHFCYGRPTISYCLAGMTDRERMKYRPDDFYTKNGVKTVLGVTAQKIDAAKKQVSCSNGKSYPYDKLLVATGSAPFVPGAEGIEKVKYHTFMTYDDMDGLDKVLSSDKKVVVIGAGLIGLKCVEGILARVKEVTVVDLADRVLQSVTDEESAAFIKRHLENQGVKFILGDCAASYTENSVTLKNSGKTLNFDILIMAAGVRPNTSLIGDIGGKVNRGVLVDNKMQTSIDGIYSAGDCTEGYDSSIGGARILALLPNAYLQGKTAGINMSGGNAEYKNAIPLNAIGFFGLHMLSAGVYEGDCTQVCGENSLKRLYIKDGVLRGFILINDIQRAGIYTSLVREKTPLCQIDLNLMTDSPQLLAFNKEVRQNKLAKRV